MVYFVSSQSERMTSCTFRFSERSGVRNMFLASCCVSVEPPCTTPPAKKFFASSAHQPDRIDAEMRAEAAVLDGDHRVRHIGRKLARSVTDSPPVSPRLPISGRRPQGSGCSADGRAPAIRRRRAARRRNRRRGPRRRCRPRGRARTTSRRCRGKSGSGASACGARGGLFAFLRPALRFAGLAGAALARRARRRVHRPQRKARPAAMPATPNCGSIRFCDFAPPFFPGSALRRAVSTLNLSI